MTSVFCERDKLHLFFKKMKLEFSTVGCGNENAQTWHCILTNELNFCLDPELLFLIKQ